MRGRRQYGGKAKQTYGTRLLAEARPSLAISLPELEGPIL